MILSIFSCAYLDLRIFSGELSIQIFWPHHFKKQSCCLFIIKLQEFFIYSGYQTFVRYMYDKYFLPDCGLTFHFNSFNRAYVSNFNVIYFIHFCLLWVLLFQILSKKSLLTPRLQRYSFMFFSWTFTVLAFTFGLWSILHVWLQSYFLREGFSNLPSRVRFPFIHSVQVTRSV